MALLTKPQQIYQNYRRAILSGDLPRGSKMPTEEVVRKNFGVSNSTVREAIMSLVNDGLVERKQGSGTFVCEIKDVANIAILSKLDTLTSPISEFYRKLITESQKLIKQDGYRPVLAVGNGECEEEFADSISLLDKPIAKKTVGVLSTVTVGSLKNKLRSAGIRSVSISHDRPHFGSGVVLDYQKLVQMGIHELLSAGLEDVAIFTGCGSDESENLRAHGRMMRWFRESGLSIPEEWQIIVPFRELEQAHDAFKKLWFEPKRPQAIFFLDEEICDVVTRTIIDLNIMIPQDLAIISQGNIGRKFYFPVPITQIQFDPVEIVREAWQMLKHVINENQEEDSVVYISPRIKKGKSLFVKL